MLKAQFLAVAFYTVGKPLGLYPALTGGILYKGPDRKDIDFVLYKNRQIDDSPQHLLHNFLKGLKEVFGDRFVEKGQFGFVTKIEIDGDPIDLLFPEMPESSDDEYGVN